MQYTIEHQTSASIRVRAMHDISREERSKISYALVAYGKVSFIGKRGMVITCRDVRETLEALNTLNTADIEMPKDNRITAQEIKERGIHPSMKNSMRAEILVESVMDLFIPKSVALGYHVYQLIRMENNHVL